MSDRILSEWLDYILCIPFFLSVLSATYVLCMHNSNIILQGDNFLIHTWNLRQKKSKLVES